MKPRGPGSRQVAEAFLGLFAERAFRLALLLSLVAHALVFLFWKGAPGEAEGPPPRAVMVARLVRRAPPEAVAPAGPPGEAAGDVEKQEAPPPPRPEPEAPAAEGAAGEAPPDAPAPPPPGEGETGLPGGGAAQGAARWARAVGRVVLEFDDGDRGTDARHGFAAALPPGVGTEPGGAVPEAGAPGSAAPARPDDLDEIRRRIESQKSYPRLARRNGWEGDVLVELRLGGDGALEGVEVVGPSSYPLLDSATVAAVRRAGPFPPRPGLVRVPVSYRLE